LSAASVSSYHTMPHSLFDAVAEPWICSSSSPRPAAPWATNKRLLNLRHRLAPHVPLGDADRADLVVPANTANAAVSIDTRLVNPLGDLPRGSFGGSTMHANDPRRNLAFRNLTRAQMLQLATDCGQSNTRLRRLMSRCCSGIVWPSTGGRS
jgi:hypothetical protein